MDKEIEKAFRHTAKLVPQSQRELFLAECVKISKHLIAQETKKVEVRGKTTGRLLEITGLLLEFPNPNEVTFADVIAYLKKRNDEVGKKNQAQGESTHRLSLDEMPKDYLDTNLEDKDGE